MPSYPPFFGGGGGGGGAAYIPPASRVDHRGDYNAATNTPALADGTGSIGDKYRVSVSGTQDFGSGPITLVEDQELSHNGTSWYSPPVGAATPVLHNLDALTDPAFDDDVADGYSIGSLWTNDATGVTFAASDVTAGAAVWGVVGASGERENVDVTFTAHGHTLPAGAVAMCGFIDGGGNLQLADPDAQATAPASFTFTIVDANTVRVIHGFTTLPGLLNENYLLDTDGGVKATLTGAPQNEITVIRGIAANEGIVSISDPALVSGASGPNSGANEVLQIKDVTAPYSIVATDTGTLLRINGTGDITFPADATAGFQVGKSVALEKLSTAGVITLIAEAGATLNTGGLTILDHMVAAVKVGANEFSASGRMS